MKAQHMLTIILLSVYACPEPATLTSTTSDVWINEWLADPGTDWNADGVLDTSDDEWIELYNRGETEVSLAGYRLGDEAKPERHEFTDETIGPHGFLVIHGSTSKIRLNNGGDTIYLTSPQGEPLHSVSYASTGKDTSQGASPDGGEHMMAFESPSPGQPNQAMGDHPATMSADTTTTTTTTPPSTTLPEETATTTTQPETTTTTSLQDTTTTTLPQDTDSAITPTTTLQQASTTTTPPQTSVQTGGEPECASPEIIITEIMPNPTKVTDTNGEYLELYNLGKETASLEGCVLSDGKRSHTINGSEEIPPQEYMALCRNANPFENGGFECGYQYKSVTLKNSAGKIRLECCGKKIDSVEYNLTSQGIDAGDSLNLNKNAFSTALNDLPANWCPTIMQYGRGDFGTPGAQNHGCRPEPTTTTTTTILIEETTTTTIQEESGASEDEGEGNAGEPSTSTALSPSPQNNKTGARLMPSGMITANEFPEEGGNTGKVLGVASILVFIGICVFEKVRK